MRRRILRVQLGTAAVITGLLLSAGCAAVAGSGQPAATGQSVTVTVTDTTGRQVTVKQPVERVAILDTGTASVLSALGVLDRLVGSHQALAQDPRWKQIANVPVVATYSEVSFEALAQARPQLVISSTEGSHGVLTDNALLKGFDIADLKLYLREPKTIKNEIMLLGKVFQREAQAQRLVDFYNRYEKMIAERVADVPENQRPTAFVEYHAGDFSTAGPGSGFYEPIVLAGGRNVAADIKGTVKVSAEWVAERDPQFILREAIGELGYSVDSTDKAAQLRADFMARPGLGTTRAVRTGNVYLLPTDIFSRPGYLVGVAHLAKWFYPDRFTDLDPEQVHREYLQIINPDLAYHGTWAYPSTRQS